MLLSVRFRSVNIDYDKHKLASGKQVKIVGIWKASWKLVEIKF